MLVEIRRYEIEPGRRDEFVRWFESEAMPAMEDAGMNILGVFVGTEDPDSFYYLRGFDSDEKRERVTRDFYEGELWLETLKPRALEMETGFHVDLVRSTGASPI